MKINAVNEYRVEVELDADEMARLGLTYDSMDWEDIDTRRALWSLAGMLRREGVGVSLSGRTLIEAQKLPDGVRLCFTGLPKGGPSRLRIKKETASPVLRCPTPRDAERAVSCLPDAAVTLYTRPDAALLLIEGTYTAAQLARAEEFGSVVRVDGAREILEEYGEKL